MTIRGLPQHCQAGSTSKTTIHYDHTGLILILQDWLNFQKSISVIHHINSPYKYMQKKYLKILIPITIIKKALSKLQIQENFLKLIKGIYKKHIAS